jgi:hypothetical protein
MIKGIKKKLLIPFLFGKINDGYLPPLIKKGK